MNWLTALRQAGALLIVKKDCVSGGNPIAKSTFYVREYSLVIVLIIRCIGYMRLGRSSRYAPGNHAN